MTDPDASPGGDQAPFPHLCFTVAAAHGAWGAPIQSAANARWLATELDPPRSALIGILAAAVGIERRGLESLSKALWVAVRTGIRPRHDLAPDFHTVTVGQRPAGRTKWSRFEELRHILAKGHDPKGAILSKREYWSTGLWAVAVAARDTAPGGLLPRLEAALRQPRWTLYAGRKACALGLPPDPAIQEAPDPATALAAYGWPWERHPALKDGTALTPLIAYRDRLEDGEQLAADTDYPGLDHALPPPFSTVRRQDLAAPIIRPGGGIYPRFEERIEARGPWPSSTPKDADEAAEERPT